MLFLLRYQRLWASHQGPPSRTPYHAPVTWDCRGWTGFGHNITLSVPTLRPRRRRLFDRVARAASKASGRRCHAPPADRSSAAFVTASVGEIAGTIPGTEQSPQVSGPETRLRLADLLTARCRSLGRSARLRSVAIATRRRGCSARFSLPVKLRTHRKPAFGVVLTSTGNCLISASIIHETTCENRRQPVSRQSG